MFLLARPDRNQRRRHEQQVLRRSEKQELKEEASGLRPGLRGALSARGSPVDVLPVGEQGRAGDGGDAVDDQGRLAPSAAPEQAVAG